MLGRSTPVYHPFQPTSRAGGKASFPASGLAAATAAVATTVAAAAVVPPLPPLSLPPPPPLPPSPSCAPPPQKSAKVPLDLYALLRNARVST